MTVKELFSHVGISNSKHVRWGDEVESSQQGIYIVSTSDLPEEPAVANQPKFNDAAIQKWIDRLPDFRIDGVRPTLTTLKNRLAQFWLPNESVLYIGQTKSSLSKRIAQYYKTELGAKGPHSGGQWLKTLGNMEDLFVYYAPTTERPKDVEDKLLNYFYSQAGELPFANLERPQGRKKHGLQGQRDPKIKK